FNAFTDFYVDASLFLWQRAKKVFFKINLKRL
ncbi:unnamed protein product, partial [marine sediment metagenome]